MSLAYSPTPAIHPTMTRIRGSRGLSKSFNSGMPEIERRTTISRLLAMTHVMTPCGRRPPSVEESFSVILKGMRCSDGANNRVLNKNSFIVPKNLQLTASLPRLSTILFLVRFPIPCKRLRKAVLHLVLPSTELPS